MTKSIVNVDGLEKNKLNKFFDGITGFASAEKGDFAHTANRLFKSLFSNEFFDQLMLEWDFYCQKGKIDLDYTNSKPYMNSLSELLDYLDTNIPNYEVAETLKKLFFISAYKDYYEDNKLLTIEYMKIIKKLSSGELAVLFATYNLIKGGIPDSCNASKWLAIVAEKSNLVYKELVEVYERRLMDLGLITARLYNDGSGIDKGKYCRLTDLGYNLCKYIENYDNTYSSANNK